MAIAHCTQRTRLALIDCPFSCVTETSNFLNEIRKELFQIPLPSSLNKMSFHDIK